MEKYQVILITGATLSGMFLSALDNTIVTTAMPTMVASLGGLSLYSWIFSIYMLTSTTAMPIFGKLADIYGRRRIFNLSIALFLIGSILCGSAQSMLQLVLFRAIQGIGGGGLPPLILTIIADIYTPQKRARMLGMFSGVWAIASIIGPLIGGFLVQTVGWRWIFYLNIPFGLVSMLVVHYFLTEEGFDTFDRPVDYLGAFYFTAGIISLLLAAQIAGDYRNAPLLIGVLSAITAIAIIQFLRTEQRVKDPILALELFRNRIIASCSLCAFLTGMGMFGTLSFVPLFVQGIMGGSPTEAGLALTPLSIGWLLGSITSGRTIFRIGSKLLITSGIFLMTIAGVIFVQLNLTSTYLFIIKATFILGCGLGLAMTTFTIAVQNAVGVKERGMATSSNMFFRTVGGAIGVSLMGVFMNARISNSTASLQAQTIPGITINMITKLQDPQNFLDPSFISQLDPIVLNTVRKMLASGLNTVFWIGLIFTILALFSSFLLTGYHHEREFISNTKD